MSNAAHNFAEKMHFTVIDVGHGSATLLRSDDEAILIDTGAGVSVIRFLQGLEITKLDCVVISHADRDHVGGLIAMLSSERIAVSRVVLNSDGGKSSTAWRNLAYDLDRFQRDGSIAVTPSLREGDIVPTSTPGLEIRAVAPRHRLVQLGVGNFDASGRKIESNSMSAVLMIKFEARPIALVTGDVDSLGWDHLREAGLDLSAEVLVVPHHGGSGGSKEQTISMTVELCEQVTPSHVFVSNGRGSHGTPRAEVISAVRRASPDARIACTQVSKNCLIKEISRPAVAGGLLFSAGARANACCAGSIELSLHAPASENEILEAHSRFVDRFASTALCRAPSDLT